ncbi:hypothetical protein KTN60_03735 [Rhodococcus qingshengii]|nr:hypothetical protein [Rhodococcus qingshengii]
MTASLICEDFPQLEGRQEPHNLSVFEGDITHGEKSIELSRRAGMKSMPWQRESQHAILSMTPAGRWTHPDCCLIVPRQNGKSEILIQRCLYGLFKLGETIIYTAQRWKTARDAWKRMMQIIKSRSWLRSRVVRSTCSQGEGIIELEDDITISFGTRSNDTGRGLTKVDLIIYDEAYNLTDGELSAMSFVQMAAENPQTIYASSAVNKDQHPNGAVLAAIRKRGLKLDEGLYFAEYMAPDDMDRESEETWKYANPSYGVVQTAEKILQIMKRLSTEAGRKGFDVEALGRGDWPVEAEDASWSVIPELMWTGLVDERPELTGPIALGMDRTLDRKWWVIAAAQRTVEGRIHVEIGYFQSAAQAEVVDYLVDIVTAWDPCALATDANSPSKVLEPLLLTAGIELIKTTGNQAVQMCGGLYDDAESKVLSHSNQPVLNDAVEGAVKRFLPQGDWALDKRGDTIVAPMVAAGLARWALLTFGSRASTPPASPAFKPPSASRSVDEFDALSAAF